ncbi:MAG TPA: M50 family metallopeptidase [Blastocatellia bacterium]|nr:M50 family metallopeptidase [Blastocatellia bacterium]
MAKKGNCELVFPNITAALNVLIRMDDRNEIKNSFGLLLICSAITVVLWFIPFIGFITYPFRMFVTLIHESGHALAALITFGSVQRITLDWNGSGLTWTNGGIRLFVSSAGYMGATVYGALLLLLLRRVSMARITAVGTAVMLLFITVFLGGNFTVWAVGLFFGIGLLALGGLASSKVVHFFMSFLAVQSLLNALFDLRTVLYISAFAPGQPSDAQNMARATNNFIPAIAWSAGWALASLVILAFTLRIYYRSVRTSGVAGVNASTNTATV